jgi:hypothetical protein
MFNADRVYSQRSASTGALEWFFSAREGEFGPYELRDAAEKMLKDFIARCLKTGSDGGRTQKSRPVLSLEPMEPGLKTFDAEKQKKGKEGG